MGRLLLLALLISMFPRCVGDEQEKITSLVMTSKTQETVKRYGLDKSNFTPFWSGESPPSVDSVKSKTAVFLEQSMLSVPKDIPGKIEIERRLTDAKRVGNRWIVTYRLAYEGIPLTDRSNISGLVTADGDKAIFRERNLPTSMDFRTSKENGKPVTEVSAIEAGRMAKSRLAALADQREVGVDIESLTPRDGKLEIWVDPETQIGHLAWGVTLTHVEAAQAESGQTYRVFVTAARKKNAKVVEIKELVQHDHQGTVQGPVWNPTPLSPPRTEKIPSITVVRATNGQPDEEVAADRNGAFDFGNGASPATIRAELRSQFFTIENSAGTLVKAATISDGSVPIKLVYGATSEADVAQISAFYWTHQVREFLSPILDDTELQNVRVKVNVTGECNAFWSNSAKTISLYRSSLPTSTKECVNRAYRDTIFHEFGHAADYAKGGLQDGAYSEGFGDSLAILFKRESCYGSNCCGPATCLREASDVVAWPSTSSGIHRRGRIYSGFVWELVQQLNKSMSLDQAYDLATRLTLEVAQRNPTSIENAVALTFEQDDDNLDLGDGSPHFKAIAAAADSRSIPRPANP